MVDCRIVVTAWQNVKVRGPSCQRGDQSRFSVKFGKSGANKKTRRLTVLVECAIGLLC